MGRSTVNYADNKTNNALKKLHNKLRPAGTLVQRVEYTIELFFLEYLKPRSSKMKNLSRYASILQTAKMCLLTNCLYTVEPIDE